VAVPPVIVTTAEPVAVAPHGLSPKLRETPMIDAFTVTTTGSITEQPFPSTPLI
jgi:hypothetical protein